MQATQMMITVVTVHCNQEVMSTFVTWQFGVAKFKHNHIDFGQRVSSVCSRQTPASDISEDRAGAAHGAVPFAAPHVTGPRPVAPTLSSIPCPLPPPPHHTDPTERPFGCGALWAPSSTRAVAPQPVQLALVAPRAGKHSLRPGAPPPARGTPSALGSQTQSMWQHPLCRRQSKSAGLTPVMPHTTAFPCRQAVVERLGSLSL